MLSRSNPAKQKSRCQCACPRNRLDGLILTQEDAISILRIVQLTAWELPITDADRQVALQLFKKQCRYHQWLIDRSAPIVHPKN